MIMTRSRNPFSGGSPVRSGGSPVRRGGSPVRRGSEDDDRSPSPSIARKSRGRMQTPSATATKSAAKSYSPPRGRTMTRSASRAASRGGSPRAQAADNVKIVAAAAAAHYKPLDAKYPDRVRAPSVSRRGHSDSSPDFSLGRASAKRDKSVERNNGSGNLRRSERRPAEVLIVATPAQRLG